MVFSSPIFLFGFLPIALLFYYASPRPMKNLVLLMVSLLFYAWGEVFYLGIMIVSILSNHAAGKLIQRALNGGDPAPKASAKRWLVVAVSVNIGLLVSFKYANFITDNLNWVLALLDLPSVDLQPVHLPLGISFFTFQAISYVADVYRKNVAAQDNLYDLALYIALFPQLIAGPIVRYQDVAAQIAERSHSLDLFADGVRRFVIGLAKKMLVANPLGEVADNVFALPGDELTLPLAWIGVLAYALQIYFDFSGYSDMAIGLGRLFGFRFLENFDHPYVAQSLREFWRRWHISLSTWFRDYVYIPLGGSRVTTRRVYVNLFIVFLLTGIWHGASWNFVVWGLFHGLFLAAERMGLSKLLAKAWRPLRHLYLVVVVLFSWVFFRADSLADAVVYLEAMLDPSRWHTTALAFERVVSREAIYLFLAGAVFSLPIYTWMRSRLGRFAERGTTASALAADAPEFALLSVLLVLSLLKVAASTYNPFIYFRF